MLDVGILLYIAGGKLGKIAGDKLGGYIGTIAGQKVGSEIISKLGSVGVGKIPVVQELVNKTTNDVGKSVGKSVGSSVGTVVGKGIGAIGGYTLGESMAKFFTEDESEITDYYVMLIDKSGNTFWLGAKSDSLITSNPKDAVLIHKGEGGINSKEDLVNKLEDDKLTEVFKDYKVNVIGVNLNTDIQTDDVIEEGLISTAIKTAAKVGGKILTKSAPDVAKVMSKPVVRKGGTLLAKKAIRSKAFRSFVKAVNHSKIFSILKNKRLIQAAAKAGNAALYADTIMDIYDLVNDYKSGKYRDVSWESIATGAATLAYVASPKDVTSGDEEFDQELVKEGFGSIQEDLKKYKEWKASQYVLNESVLLFEESETFRTYFNILFESASAKEKFELIKKADPEFAKVLEKSVNSSGNTKIDPKDAQKIKGLVSQGDDKNIDKIQHANHKVDEANVKKILEKESEVKSILGEIFSKEMLISLIPFSTLPTIEDIDLFFGALHDWVNGKYQFDDADKSELVSIGVDVGITTIVLATGGIAAFATFGISMILAILGSAATIGYVVDSMVRIARNYKERNGAMAPAMV